MERGIGYTWREGVKLLGDAFRPAVLVASAALTLFIHSLPHSSGAASPFTATICPAIAAARARRRREGDTWPTEDHYTLENSIAF